MIEDAVDAIIDAVKEPPARVVDQFEKKQRKRRSFMSIINDLLLNYATFK